MTNFQFNYEFHNFILIFICFHFYQNVRSVLCLTPRVWHETWRGGSPDNFSALQGFIIHRPDADSISSGILTILSPKGIYPKGKILPVLNSFLKPSICCSLQLNATQTIKAFIANSYKI